ncbi:MAG: type IV toxin-antitoxin system AbiEi family antitoxin [Thermoprotei archaeon]
MVATGRSPRKSGGQPKRVARTWYRAHVSKKLVSRVVLISSDDLYCFALMRLNGRKSAIKYRRTLSDRESRILSTLSYSGKTIFTVRDIKEFTGNPRGVIDPLIRKRWVLKIRKGVYAIAPFEAGELGAASYTLHSFVVASVLVEPYYIGYWSALNHHRLTDQTPPAVYVATTKPRHSRRILDTYYRFVTIPPHKMFGVEEVEIEGRKVRVSTREKTLVDCLDHPEHAGGIEEVAKALYFSEHEIDFNKLADYANKIGNGAVPKRLGYIAQTLGYEELSQLLFSERLTSGYSLLDPTLSRRGRIVERWRLVVNTEVNTSRWAN